MIVEPYKSSLSDYFPCMGILVIPSQGLPQRSKPRFCLWPLLASRSHEGKHDNSEKGEEQAPILYPEKEHHPN
jgi:hypothetical protein